LPNQLVPDAVYNTLIAKLKAQGIPTYVMPYDWANGGVQAAALELDAFIKGLPYTQVDIIAHSLGGLVAQQYIHDRLIANKSPNVRNLVLLASPNQGAVLAHCFVYASYTCVGHAEYSPDWILELTAAALVFISGAPYNVAPSSI